MKFLLDESVSPLVAGPLAAAGYEVVHARDVGLRSAPDSTVLAAALAEGHVLVTLDTDFAALIAQSGEQLPSVVLFRGVVTRRPAAQAALLLANLQQFAVDVDQGAVVEVEPALALHSSWLARPTARFGCEFCPGAQTATWSS